MTRDESFAGAKRLPFFASRDWRVPYYALAEILYTSKRRVRGLEATWRDAVTEGFRGVFSFEASPRNLWGQAVSTPIDAGTACSRTNFRPGRNLHPASQFPRCCDWSRGHSCAPSEPRIPSGLALIAALFLLLAGVGCQKQTEQKTDASPAGVAQVGGTTIRVEAFKQLMRQRAGRDPGRYASAAAKEALLDEMIGQEAVYAKAKAAGFDQRPDIRESIKQMVIAKFREEELGRSPAAPGVSEQEIQQYFQEHQAKYAMPAKARGAMIFIHIPAAATPEKRADFLARAQSILEEAKAAEKMAEFATVVQRNSEDQATRYRGGDIGWVTRDAKDWGLEPALVDALFSVEKPGDFAPLVITEKGVYIAKLLEARPAGVRSITEIRPEIAYILARQKGEKREKDFYHGMKTGLDIRINRPLLDSIRPPAPENALPPSIPGNATAQLK